MEVARDRDSVSVLLIVSSLAPNIIIVTLLLTSSMPVSQISLRGDVPST